ncbi:unnamed protein product [Rhodiola kirilowii]
MIGSLLYLTASRPDIAYAVGVCARYHADPKESHLLQVKRIIKYVCRTVDFGIWYTKDTNPYWLVTAMLTGQEMLKNRRARLEVVSSWETTWFPGSVKSKIASRSLRPKRSISLQEVAALNCCG